MFVLQLFVYYPKLKYKVNAEPVIKSTTINAASISSTAMPIEAETNR